MTLEEALDRGMVPTAPVLRKVEPLIGAYEEKFRVVHRLKNQEYTMFDTADKLLCIAGVHWNDDEELCGLYNRVVLDDRPFQGALLFALIAQGVQEAWLLDSVLALAEESGVLQGQLSLLSSPDADGNSQKTLRRTRLHLSERARQDEREHEDSGQRNEGVPRMFTGLRQEETAEPGVQGKEKSEGADSSGKEKEEFGCGHMRSPENTYVEPKTEYSRCRRCRQRNHRVQNAKRIA